MLRFAANISMLFTELPFLQRFHAAARAGFGAVEFSLPEDLDPVAIAATLKSTGLTLVQFDLPTGNRHDGLSGMACLPDRTEEFRALVQKAIGYAKILGCHRVNCISGTRPKGCPEILSFTTFVENLKYAAARLGDVGIGLLLEPINSHDYPNFFVDRPSMGFKILDKVGSNNLKLNYDVYHAQKMEGNLFNTLSKEILRIGHIEIAGIPGRNEPGSGEINWMNLFNTLDELGYSGWIGCSYRPLSSTKQGLVWLENTLPLLYYTGGFPCA